jgi:multiple sugar transport system permease protein
MAETAKARSEALVQPRSFLGLQEHQKEAMTGWLMASPAIVLILFFLIIPFLLAFVLSLTNQRLISPNPTEFVGLKNYANLLKMNVLSLDPILDEAGNPVLDEEGNLTYPALRDLTRNNPDYPQYDGMQEWKSITIDNTRWILLASDVVFIKALFNTFYFALIVVPVQGGLGLALAILVNKRMPGTNIFRVVYFMPVVVSMVIVSVLWSFIYDGQNGLLNAVLNFITFGAFQPVDWLANPKTAMPALIVMSIWQGVGFHMVIWLSGLQTIPGTLYEAASVEGANTWQQFRFVTWPGLRNTAIFVLVTITMQAFGLYQQVQVMTRGGPLDATQSVIFQSVIRGYEKQSIAGGSAIAVVFFLMVVTISIIQGILTREKEA